MDLNKIYHDQDGNECNILQLVKQCPEWAANIIQHCEKEISQQGETHYRCDICNRSVYSTKNRVGDACGKCEDGSLQIVHEGEV